jgi:hypothetical protein
MTTAHFSVNGIEATDVMEWDATWEERLDGVGSGERHDPGPQRGLVDAVRGDDAGHRRHAGPDHPRLARRAQNLGRRDEPLLGRDRPLDARPAGRLPVAEVARHRIRLQHGLRPAHGRRARRRRLGDDRRRQDAPADRPRRPRPEPRRADRGRPVRRLRRAAEAHPGRRVVRRARHDDVRAELDSLVGDDRPAHRQEPPAVVAHDPAQRARRDARARALPDLLLDRPRPAGPLGGGARLRLGHGRRPHRATRRGGIAAPAIITDRTAPSTAAATSAGATSRSSTTARTRPSRRTSTASPTSSTTAARRSTRARAGRCATGRSCRARRSATSARRASTPRP